MTKIIASTMRDEVANMAGRLWLITFVALVVCATVSCSDDSGSSNAQPTAAITHALGLYSKTWVDTSRVTQRNGTAPELPSRTLRTVYLYPATGAATGDAVEGANPDIAGGPYPIAVFAHGFSSSPEDAMDQITALAQAGFVVVAPAFPLTNKDAVGGVNGDDLVNQTADVSFVIGQTIEMAKGTDSPLSGLVNPDEIAAGGHSGGGVTTMGFMNTCCRDPRVKALYVWAGAVPEHNDGKYDYTNGPPVLFVHGTNDEFFSCETMIEVFNQVTGLKAFLKMEGEDHASWAVKTDNSFDKVMSTTIDFVNVFLRSDIAAKARLIKGEDDDQYKLVAALDPGAQATLPTAPPSIVDRKATVTPNTGLKDGQEVTVSWSGFLQGVGHRVHVIECSASAHSGACDVNRGKLNNEDSAGAGSVKFIVHTGAIGNGQCDPGGSNCNITVNDSGLSEPGASVEIPISFD